MRRMLGLLLVAHLVATCVWFDPRQLLSPDPITSGDSAIHDYNVVAADGIWKQDHRTSGYDPFFMAGYPAGIPFDVDARGAEWFCRAGAGIGLARGYKLFAFVALLMAPLLVYFAARQLRLGDTETLATLLLVLALWHFGRPHLGHLRWAGKFTFLLASGLGVFLLAAARRTMVAPRAASAVSVAGLAAVTWQIHALAVPMLLPGFITLFALSFQRLRRRELGFVAAGIGLVLAANADWIVPLVQHRAARPPTAYWLQFDGWREIVTLFTRSTSILLVTIVGLGIAGALRLARRDRAAAWVFIVTAVTWFAVAFFGARVPALASIDPGRFLIPFGLSMTIPAGIELGHWLEASKKRFGAAPSFVLLVAGAAAIPLLAVAGNRILDRNVIEARVAPEIGLLARFIADNTSTAARILFETPGGPSNPSPLPYGMQVQALLPLYMQREFIGGPNPAPYLSYASVDLKNGELLGRPLATWAEDDFGRYLETYNVGWIVCRSEAARAYVSEYAAATPIDTVEDFTLYRVHRAPSWFANGDGRVQASYNRIEVDGATGDEIVLKYHWVHGLRSTPRVAIDDVPIAGDPIGFIRVRPNGMSRFVLHMGR